MGRSRQRAVGAARGLLVAWVIVATIAVAHPRGAGPALRSAAPAGGPVVALADSARESLGRRWG